MKKIIIATDFSPASTNAVQYGAEMALSVNAQMILLHVYQSPVTYTDLPVLANMDMIPDLENDMATIKKDIAIKFGTGLMVETELRPGYFFHELRTFCEQVNPYLVILGSQGTTAAGRFFFGSHTIHAMQKLSWPVIAVPLKATFNGIRKIGFACDFRSMNQQVPTEEIKSLVSDFKAELYILHSGNDEEVEPALRSRSIEMTGKLGQVKQEFHFPGDAGVDEAIIAFADEHKLDLLVILPHEYNLTDLLFHKSHTKKFVLLSQVPVMAFHKNSSGL
jgi:Universal stress protein UspA and related nucleotide-binding proteins